jgi:hypothetical protein
VAYEGHVQFAVEHCAVEGLIAISGVLRTVSIAKVIVGSLLLLSKPSRRVLGRDWGTKVDAAHVEPPPTIIVRSG